jgi:hypothetical protein
MQHREIITRKLEQIEGNLANMDYLLSRGGNANQFADLVNNIKEIIQDVKDYVDREPRTPGEFNNFNR